MKRHGLILILLVLGTEYTLAANFFTIQRIDYQQKGLRNGRHSLEEVEKRWIDKKKVKEEVVFVSCLEVHIVIQEQTKASDLFVKAYFYDKDNKLIEASSQPAVVKRVGGGKYGQYNLPVIFPKGKVEKVFFVIPDIVLKQEKWQVLVVFGDQQEADARTYPFDVLSKLEYPEKGIVENKDRTYVQRKAAMDPIIEHVVKTGNPKQPKITLFMRPPIGMTDASEAKGVLAMCLLAWDVGNIKRQLQGIEPGQEVNGLMEFAEKNKLLILCWGARSLWDPRKSWDEQKRAVNKEMDETFDEVANAWANGVEELAKKYGIPDKNFLLWGTSGSAQYACRLALRKPEYFLAIHVHVPSSFDKPTSEANHVLWLLTTGELESGYERSKRFYVQCRELGYPMVYKAIVGLGHSGSSRATALGLKFYEYALSLRDQREVFDKSLKDSSKRLQAQKQDGPLQPWPESFRTPAFLGDIVNQEIFPFEQQEMVPVTYRVALPTKEIADMWKLQ